MLRRETGGGFGRPLLSHHAEMLAKSAIGETVARERGYWSATEPKQLELLFGSTQRRLVPALVIPIYDVQGERVFCQLRPDSPRVLDGKARKYEIPAKTKMAVGVHPRVRPKLGDPSVPLIVTEGAKKADAAVSVGLYAIDLIGVWNWRGRNDDDGLTVLADWEWIALKDRDVYLAFDSDSFTNLNVFAALKRLRAFLEKKGASVPVIYLPSGDGGAKVGLDDFIAAGHGKDDVLALASDRLRAPARRFRGRISRWRTCRCDRPRNCWSRSRGYSTALWCSRTARPRSRSRCT